MNDKLRFSLPIEMTADYKEWICVLKARIRSARLSAALKVNAEQIKLYYDIGCEVLDRLERSSWGDKVLESVSRDIREEFPGIEGFSVRNIKYMKVFAREWQTDQIGQRLVAQLPWGHNILLLEQLKSATDRIAYAKLTIANGWSRAVLEHQIELKAAKKSQKTLANFKLTLPDPDSDLAEQTFKDSYNLSFLGATEKVRENKLRAMLVDRAARFIVELGVGFSYVGKAMTINVGGEDFEMDLLFYHVILHRYVVIELKTRRFKPQDLGQLSFYMSAVDRQVKSKQDGKTIGLLLCKSRNDVVVEYALSDMRRPMGVSTYQLGLPSTEELQKRLNEVLALPDKSKRKR